MRNNGGQAKEPSRFLRAIPWFVALNLWGADIPKFLALPFSVALFTKMSNAFHGIIPQPAFRVGAGVVEVALGALFLAPRTARLASALTAVYMVPVLLSHVFVLGYDIFFVDALLLLALCGFYRFRAKSNRGNRAKA